MNQQELIQKLGTILEDSKTGVLATIDQSGKPHMRWMTPVLIKGRNGVIFTVTSPRFMKIDEINNKPYVEWMIQTRSLDQIISIKGKVNILDNPSIKTEVIEAIGSKLTMFWKVNRDFMDFVVLETVIEEAVYYHPIKAIKETITFTRSRLVVHDGTGED